MKTPPIMTREDERLEELRAYDVLDSAEEQAFDELTFLASVICKTPIALVSLVDDRRQWFKSRVGLAAKETPREVSFCGHAIAGRELFEVPDARADERFHDNPLVTGDPRVRFYAAAQLVTAKGLAIGTLCVIAHEPRSLDAEQRRALKALARQVVNQLERRRFVGEAFSRIGALTRNEERYRSLSVRLEDAQRTAKIGSWELDLASRRETWSLEHFRIFEVPPTNDGALLHSLHVTSLPPGEREQLERHLAAARGAGLDFTLDHRLLFEGQRVKHIRTIGRVVKNANGEPLAVVGTRQDRTAEVQTETSLELERAKALQSAKLASLGELAAGMAHEINNPLAIISGTLHALPKFLDQPEKLAARLKTVEKAVERVAKIVTGLRKFARASEAEPKTDCRLRGIAEEAIVLVQTKASRDGVSVRLHIESDGEIHCNEIEIEQVLVNLLNNGIDAAKRSEERWVELVVDAVAGAGLVRVRDSGPGFAEGARDKLFQPFFTTKPVGEGTGLGLAIAKGILDEHGATISLLDEDPCTCFEIHFPAVSAARRGAA